METLNRNGENSSILSIIKKLQLNPTINGFFIYHYDKNSILKIIINLSYLNT